MDWHSRYMQQANWTRDLRSYLFEKTGLERAQSVLEVGCGTGAILSELATPASLHGLDLDPAALTQSRLHAPAVFLTRGDALALPYHSEAFDIVYCHFLLLWVRDPLQVMREMKRVTCRGGHVLALAEPDYSARVDRPPELTPLGIWQTEALRQQGANPSFGARLAETFLQAGIRLMETGPIQSAALQSPSGLLESGSKGQATMRSADEWEQEWDVLEADVAGIATAEAVSRMKGLDQRARSRGERVLHVPTYFAWGTT